MIHYSRAKLLLETQHMDAYDFCNVTYMLYQCRITMFVYTKQIWQRCMPWRELVYENGGKVSSIISHKSRGWQIVHAWDDGENNNNDKSKAIQ
jgi:hypothetical protein